MDSSGAARESAARSKPPPRAVCRELVELRHIRGDLHMHTTETDGRATLEEMAEAARERGYEYIAITDHSKALAMANGLDEERVVAFAQQVREMNQRRAAASASSPASSATSCATATMDLADDALAELDLVIGSVHSHMNLEPAEMTDRLLRALECPHLAHPGTSDRPPAAASRSVSRSISTAWRRRRCGAASGWKSTPAPSGWTSTAPLIRTAKAKGASSPSPPTRIIRSISPACATAYRRRGADGWRADDIMNTRPVDEFAKALIQNMKYHLEKSAGNCGLSGDRGPCRRSGRIRDQASVVRHGGSAVMMAVDEKKRMLLVRQYRLPAQGSICGNCRRDGGPGEKPLQAAKRELTEETGYEGEEVEEAGFVLRQPRLRGGEDDDLPRRGSDRRRRQPMDDERIEMQWFRAQDLDEMIRREDSLTPRR